MTVTLWKGYHGGGLADQIRAAWDRPSLLVLCPPLLQDFSFLGALPAGDLIFTGTWTNSEVEAARSIARAGEDLPFAAVLGVFTSGTLSTSPRLVLYSRENVMASLDGIFALFDRSRIGHVYCYPQAFHTFGLVLGYVAAHVFGWRLHTPHGKYQRHSHEDRLALREENVLTLGTPTHFYDLLRLVESTGAEIVPSYTSIMGGAGVSRSLWQATREHLRIEAPSIGYGCTEAAPGISHLAPGRAPVVDDEIGQLLPSLHATPGAEGVSIEGPALCQAIIQNGQIEFPRRLTIRDRLVMGENGSWIYGGRLDLTLNRGGQKFSLEAIEKRLHDQLQVGVVATGVRDTRFGEDLGLAMIHGGPSPQEEIISAAKDLLLREFDLKWAGRRVLFLSDFPLNECSKLDRRATRRRLEDLP